jgi:hypothetical protein
LTDTKTYSLSVRIDIATAASVRRWVERKYGRSAGKLVRILLNEFFKKPEPEPERKVLPRVIFKRLTDGTVELCSDCDEETDGTD